MVILVVATTTDPASINPALDLLSMPGWHPAAATIQDGMKSYEFNEHGRRVRLLLHDKGIVEEDDLDLRWEHATNEVVDEIIFFSKHTAVSNRPALTVHPIGVPRLQNGDVPPQGGKPGWAALPSPRMGPWIRLLKNIADLHNLIPEFEITMEATHHGPVTISQPCISRLVGNIYEISNSSDVSNEIKQRAQCKKTRLRISEGRCLSFILIQNVCENPGRRDHTSSTEEYWKSQDAARVIALLVWEGLGLGGEDSVGDWSRENNKGKVLLGLGGGHYVPRHMDVIQKDGVWAGHLLSGYSLPMEDPGKKKDGSPSKIIGGTWRNSIKAAVAASTWKILVKRKMDPGGEMLAHLDHKYV